MIKLRSILGTGIDDDTSRVSVERKIIECVMCLKYRMGYVKIPKPNEGINSRCYCFDLLL